MKTCGAQALALLARMRQKDSLAAADDGGLKVALEAIMATAVVGALTHRHTLLSELSFLSENMKPRVSLNWMKRFRNCVLAVWSCSRGSWATLWSRRWPRPPLLWNQLPPG